MTIREVTADGDFSNSHPGRHEEPSALNLPEVVIHLARGTYRRRLTNDEAARLHARYFVATPQPAD